MEAVLRGDVNAINKALSQGANVNIMDRNGNTPLALATIREDIEAFDALLSHKDIDVNLLQFRNYGDKHTILFWLVGRDTPENLKLLKSLLNHKDIDVNLAIPYQGITALMWAVQTNNLKAVKLLWYQKGINVKAVDKYGNSIYDFVQTNGMESLLKTLSASW